MFTSTPLLTPRTPIPPQLLPNPLVQVFRFVIFVLRDHQTCPALRLSGLSAARTFGDRTAGIFIEPEVYSRSVLSNAAAVGRPPKITFSGGR